jgi:hypothetical protein
MTNLRIFWIAWCCAWALAWLLAGFFTLGLAWLMVPVSLLALLLPVGQTPPPRPPAPPYLYPPQPWGGICAACGWPRNTHTAYGLCPCPPSLPTAPNSMGYK